MKRTVLIAAACSLLVPSPALAADDLVEGGRLAAGPRLAGNEVLRLVGAPESQLSVEATDLTTRVTRQVAAFGRGGQLVQWDASAELLAVHRLDSHSGGTSAGVSYRDLETFDAGPRGGPLERLIDCPRGESLNERFAFSLDGARLAWVSGQCSGPRNDQAVVVRDFATGQSARLPIQQGVAQVALAGDFLAVGGPLDRYDRTGTAPFDTSSEYLAVYDWPSGGLLHYSEDRDTRNNSVRITDFALQADGKLALVQLMGGTPGCYGVAWFQVGSTTRHQLPLCVESSLRGSGIHLAGDRIAVPVTDQPDDRPSNTSQLVVSDLAGLSRPVFAQPVPLAPARFFRHDLSPAFDFDGSRVAYPDGACWPGDDRVRIEDLEEPRATPSRSICPVGLLRSSVRVSRSGVVSVEARCPQGCRLQQFALRGNGGPVYRLPRDVIRPGERARIGAPLPPRSFRSLKRTGRRRINLEVRAEATYINGGDEVLLRNVVLKWPRRR